MSKLVELVVRGGDVAPQAVLEEDQDPELAEQQLAVALGRYRCVEGEEARAWTSRQDALQVVLVQVDLRDSPATSEAIM